jgi:hypothetical protein
MSETSIEQALAHARSAAASRRWAEAFELFRRADSTQSLPVDDLDTYSTAAYLLGHIDVAIDALTRRQGLLLDTDQLQQAVRCGVWVILMLLNKGGFAEAGGWIGRTGHLVEKLPPDCAERGYMLSLRAGDRKAAIGGAGKGRDRAGGKKKATLAKAGNEIEA